MTLKEQKIAIEQSVANAIKNSLTEGVEVNVNYDLQGIVTINLQTPEEKNGSVTSFVHYTIAYNEEMQRIAISAFQRALNADNFGPVAIINSPVVIDEDFMMSIKMIIENSMKMSEPTSVEAAAE